MAHYDPRIVDLYDEDNPDGPDHEFYRSVADELDARSILDLGCGTGMLTVSFASDRRRVVGVDPDETMLAFARSRAGAQAVEWELGDSRDIPAGEFDYAVMTGNVAQHIPDGAWTRSLADLRRSLRSGGVLAFESRNPAVRAWDEWASADRTMRETPHGPLIEWMEADETAPGVVTLTSHNLFVTENEEVTEIDALYFRERTAIERQLRGAGFEVEAVYGDWERGPFVDSSRLMIFVSRAR